jgi:para-aminobenzoate synthetase component 1
VSAAPAILTETTLADWAAAGEGWTHFPYLASFAAPVAPSRWAPLLTGRHHAVLESGRSGQLTIVVPRAPRALSFHAGGRVVVAGETGAHEEPAERPLAYLRRWSREVRAPRLPGWPAFQGGLVAALAYELATQLEPVPAAPSDPELPLLTLLEAHEALVHEAATGRLTAVVLVPAGGTAAHRAARERAQALAAAWFDAVATAADALPAAASAAVPLRASLEEPAFARAVEQAQAYIAAGDTYQVNLSTRLEVPPVDALVAYEAMRAGNPSPYMGYARLPGAALACGSPELLVSVDAGRVASRPIAGTRPRGSDEAADLAWARELAGDTKERAEHLMLVDLLRNDVGRVAAPGTVQVPEFMAVERYSHVMHLVSQVEGRLAPGASPADVIRALFPGGTITGAPKVRTMQVIAELEPVARGFYTGSFGWIGATGELCLNIVIRSLWVADGRAFVQAGAGVVADSVPRREYAEAWRKAQAPLLAAARAARPSC